MPDPLTTTILAAAGGAATKEIVSKIWDSGNKWLAAFFADHQPEAKQAAEQNAAGFVTDLASKIERLEQGHIYDKAFFSKAFKEPSFSVLLQKAILNAAQTSETGKHQLLAKLVSEKLLAKEETTLSLASQMACDAIAFATPNQLKILGLLCALTQVRPTFNPQFKPLREHYLATCQSWSSLNIAPFLDVEISGLDVTHLEALGCLKHLNIALVNLDQILSNWQFSGHTISSTDLFGFSFGPKIKEYWTIKGLQHMVTTSVGTLVGIYVVDSKTGGQTSLVGWN